MFNVRKLAAIDLQVLGPKIILTEFGLGVVGSLALGLLTVRAGIQRFHSTPMIVFGVYLLCSWYQLCSTADSCHQYGARWDRPQRNRQRTERQTRSLSQVSAAVAFVGGPDGGAHSRDCAGDSASTYDTLGQQSPPLTSPPRQRS